MVSANRGASAAGNDDEEDKGFTFDELINQKGTVSKLFSYWYDTNDSIIKLG